MPFTRLNLCVGVNLTAAFDCGDNVACNVHQGRYISEGTALVCVACRVYGSVLELWGKEERSEALSCRKCFCFYPGVSGDSYSSVCVCVNCLCMCVHALVFVCVSKR